MDELKTEVVHRELEEEDCAPGEVLITVQFSGFFNRTEMPVDKRHNDDIARWKGKFPDYKTAQAFIDNMARMMSGVLEEIQAQRNASTIWTADA